MNNPKISVIIVYNNKNNLEKCINEIQRQTFSNIEIICVDNASEDDAQNIVKKYAKEDERIKFICLPFKNEESFAKKAALGVANGDYICFITPNDDISTNFLTENFVQSAVKSDFSINNNHLYKRIFLENEEEINDLINERVKKELEKYTQTITEIKNQLKEEFDKFYRINAENIKNSTYEISCKFNNLENFVYEKEDKYNKKFTEKDEIFNNELIKAAELCKEKSLESVHQIYDDISRVYDYINSKMDEKGTEINKIYDEISKNYHYTEELMNSKKGDFSNIISEIENKLSSLEKDIILRYANLKRITDIRIDDLKLKLNSVTGQETAISADTTNYINNSISENMDNLYEQINNNGSNFYSELTNIYKDLNEKIQKERADYKYELSKKIDELKNEIDLKFSNK